MPPFTGPPPTAHARAIPTIAFALALAPGIAHAAPPAPPPPPPPRAIELVQSVPVETPLAQPDLPTARDTFVDLLRGARRTVDLAQFYLSTEPGSALEDVIAELAAAGRRGVRIRLLVSSVLVGEYRSTVDRVARLPGVELRVLDLRHRTGGILHAKYWLVDGRELFLGSQNFDWRSLSHIHELGVRVRDAGLAARLATIFEADWRLAAPTPATGAPAAPAPVAAAPPLDGVELTASPPALAPPGVRPSLDALVELLGGARHSLDAQVLTYSPVEQRGAYWPALDVALRAAAARHVKVRLLVSDWSTGRPAIDHLKSLAVLPGVEVRIVTIPPARSGFIPFARVAHSKYAVVDGTALWIGTSNWSSDYFAKSRNVDLVVRRPDVAAQAARVFSTLWQSPFAAPIELGRSYVPPRRDSPPTP